MAGAVDHGRVSDRARRNALTVLRARWTEGAMGLDTFEHRVAGVYAARDLGELRALVVDVVEPSRWRVAAERAATAWRVTTTPALESPPRVPGIPLGLVREPVLLGRSRQCDVVLARDSVSRRHAELRRDDDGGWSVTDLDSLNGTWLNGRRVGRASVLPGDELVLGDAPLLLE